MLLKRSSAKWRPFCPGGGGELNNLNPSVYEIVGDEGDTYL